MASCLHAEERVGGPREGSVRTGCLEVDSPALEDAGQAGSSFPPVMGEQCLQPASPRWWATRPAVKPDEVSQGKRTCRMHGGACGNGASGKEPPGWAARESSPPGPYSAHRGNESRITTAPSTGAPGEPAALQDSGSSLLFDLYMVCELGDVRGAVCFCPRDRTVTDVTHGGLSVRCTTEPPGTANCLHPDKGGTGPGL